MKRNTENQSLKERNITLKLYDSEVKLLAAEAARAGLSIAELLENFIADLTDSPRTNGSDERMHAENWYNRCWFGMFPTPTMQGFCSAEWIEIDEVLERIEDVDDLQEEIDAIKKHQAEETDEEELGYLKEELEGVQEALAEAKEDVERFWNDYQSWAKRMDSTVEIGTFDEEILKLKQWKNDLDELLKGE